MKTVVHKFSFIIVLLVAISCNKKDEHSLGEFRINIATVVLEGENTYSLLLDNGKRLWPAASDVRYAPVNDQRVFVNYTTLSNEKDGYAHYVKINDIWNILTKEPIMLTPQNEDSIGYDPVKINAVWVGNDYLNIDFMFNYGGIRPHAVNLVINTLSSEATPDALDLEFRHNAYESPGTRLYEGFVCFDLKPLQRPGVDSVKLTIKVKDWDDEKTYDVVYRYNQAALQNTFAETPIPVVSSNEYY
ncbi:NigD-like protein [Petrimonas sp.]|uniref:NigD-like protein n=1 Tax=Petrimonas sp. TaxID=2023866 RepID=UPI003F515FAC